MQNNPFMKIQSRPYLCVKPRTLMDRLRVLMLSMTYSSTGLDCGWLWLIVACTSCSIDTIISSMETHKTYLPCAKSHKRHLSAIVQWQILCSVQWQRWCSHVYEWLYKCGVLLSRDQVWTCLTILFHNDSTRLDMIIYVMLTGVVIACPNSYLAQSWHSGFGWGRMKSNLSHLCYSF